LATPLGASRTTMSLKGLPCVALVLTVSYCSLVDCLWSTWPPCRGSTRRVGKSPPIHRNRSCCFHCSLPPYSFFRPSASEDYDKRMARSNQRISQGTPRTPPFHLEFASCLLLLTSQFRMLTHFVYRKKSRTRFMVLPARDTRVRAMYRASRRRFWELS
jgi:hypothetical protein